MIADLVEEAEIKTKRRNEGVFFRVGSLRSKSNARHWCGCGGCAPDNKSVSRGGDAGSGARVRTQQLWLALRARHLQLMDDYDCEPVTLLGGSREA